MANPFSKGWNYLKASLDSKIDENADPKVQIQQAAEAAKKQHQEITQQAAAIIGNKKQLEMKLDRLIKSQADHQDKARTALLAADQAAASGDSEKARQLNGTAEILASQLVAVEQELADTKALHAQAAQAAEQAQRQQQESDARLKEQMAQINELRAQADQAAMQQTATKAMDSIGAVSQDSSVPTMDAVREKIERRYAEALGAQELTQSSVQGQIAEISQAGTDMKAAARLAEIRAAMAGDSAAAGELISGEQHTSEESEKLEESAEEDMSSAEHPVDSSDGDEESKG